ncbi:hypothetical protein, partial [Salinivibrio sp. PR932]|uniref:hypothetical protein n=1 Tax=Salinivibrio sp. PR932 TaxID=1909492 RepID=UPI001A7E05A6
PCASLPFETVSTRIKDNDVGWVFPNDNIEKIKDCFYNLNSEEVILKVRNVINYQMEMKSSSVKAMAESYFAIYLSGEES